MGSLEELANSLLKQAQELPPGADRNDALKDIGKLRQRLEALKNRHSRTARHEGIHRPAHCRIFPLLELAPVRRATRQVTAAVSRAPPIALLSCSATVLQKSPVGRERTLPHLTGLSASPCLRWQAPRLSSKVPVQAIPAMLLTVLVYPRTSTSAHR